MSVANSKDVADCISNWLAYLQMLTGLCSAGSRLSNCFCGLVTDNPTLTIQCQAMWEELVRACTVASSNIKTQVLPALQELTVSELNPDTKSLDSNQVVNNSLAAFINLQYQLCAACCECLAPILGCPCPPLPPTSVDQLITRHHEPDCSAEAMQKCFQRLFPPPSSNTHQAKSPQSFSLSPIQAGCQRRWSEAAAQDTGTGGVGSGDNQETMRRWSMPWETSSRMSDQQPTWPGSRLMPKQKQLAVPAAASPANDTRSRSTTPESAWHSSMASQEELQEVIQLLSCPMPNSNTKPSPSSKPTLPGVILTGCSNFEHQLSSSELWSDGVTPSGSRRGSNSPHRGAQYAGHLWPQQQPPTQDDVNTPDVSPVGLAANLDPSSLPSRKSSSSTDSSSSYSLHNRSTTGSISAASTASTDGGGQQEFRSQGYSMWGGADAPLIKFPDPTETFDEHPTQTLDIRHTFYTPKSY